MKLLFASFRTLNRNLGMIWPPVAVILGFLLLALLSVMLLAVSLGDVWMQAFLGRKLNPEQIFAGWGPVMALLLLALLLLFGLLGMFVSAFVSGGFYQLASSVLEGNKKYWGSFFRGGFRYLGWSLLFMLVTIGSNLLAEVVSSLMQATTGRREIADAVSFILSIVVQYLLLLFYPALIDGREGFGKALATSFRLAWPAFRETIFPAIGLIITGVIVFFALMGLGYLIHPVVTFIGLIPLILYLLPLLPIWATLVYRKLTRPANPLDPHQA